MRACSRWRAGVVSGQDTSRAGRLRFARAVAAAGFWLFPRWAAAQSAGCWRSRRWFHDDGQLNLPIGGHAELPGGGQRDYFA
jgi:hypothetical protein